MSGKLVLITGVTGFVAGNVVDKFLEAGYRVRGTTRGAKAAEFNKTIKVPGLEFVQIDDVATSDFTEALKGVYAVIHVASPMPGRTTAEDTLRSAKEGTLNVLRQAVTAGIKKVVVTSSFGALLEADLARGFTGETFNGSEWGSTTLEEVKAREKDYIFVYFASKIFAEKAVWEFAKEHPQLDIATIQPGLVYGPFSKHLPPLNPKLGTNGFIYSLITGNKPPPTVPVFVDVRDIAEAHVKALNVPPKPLEYKRYLVNGGLLSWKEAAEYLRKERPDLTVLPPEEIISRPGVPSTWDTSKAAEELGMTFIPPKDTLIAAIDSLLEAKKAFPE